jgi:hypothetical protein
MGKAGAAVLKSGSHAGVSPVSRPSLPYMYAFDLCAVEAQREHKPTALLASSAFFAYEMVKRLAAVEITLVIAPDDEAAYVSRVAWDELERSPVLVPTLDEIAGTFSTVIWAQPHLGTLDRVSSILAGAGTLFLIIPGWSARFLPEAGITETDGFASSRRAIERRLRQGGFVVDAIYGFHGLTSITWGYVARVLAYSGRNDLADRCRFKMRSTFCVQDWQALFASVKLVITRRK